MQPGLANALVALLEPLLENRAASRALLGFGIPVFLTLWACLWQYSRGSRPHIGPTPTDRLENPANGGEPIRAFHLIGLAALVATPGYLLICWSGTLMLVMGSFLTIALVQAMGKPIKALRCFGKNLVFFGLIFAALDTGFMLLGRR
jgi:hypothetical protein